MQIMRVALMLLGMITAAAGAVEETKELPLRVPVVRSMFPLGGQAGHRVPVEFEGDFLDGARVRCECQDLRTKVQFSSSVRVKVEFELSGGLAPGSRVIYLESARGASNRLLFRVTGWTSVVEAESNDTVAQAQAVPTPAIVEGRIARLTDVDFFKFNAGAGERIAFNVLAARSKAPGFVSISLLSGSGRELAHNNARIGPDAYLDYTFPDAGEYLIVVTPRRFADFFTVVKDDQLINWQYQLAIGRRPMVWSVFPIGGKRGSALTAEMHADFLQPQAKVVFSGKGLEGTITPKADPCSCKYTMDVRIANDAELGTHWLTVPDNSGTTIPIGFQVGDLPEIVESQAKPQAVELPVTINGRIAGPQDRGIYRIKVNQEDVVTFVMDAHGLGSGMTDPQLVLVRAGGDIVDTADERCRKCGKFESSVAKKDTFDPKMTHAFISASANDADAAGEYDAIVLDNSSRKTSDRPYRLTIRKNQPNVQVGVTTNHVHARTGQYAKVPVAVLRDEGFEDEVTITVRGLPTGWTAKPLTIPKGSDSADLEIAREDGTPTTGAFEVLGNSQVALLPPVFGEDGFGYLEMPHMSVNVSFVESPVVSLRVEEQSGGFVVERGGPAPVEIPVVIERAKGFDGDLKFAIEDAPDGVSIKSLDDTHVWLIADSASSKPGRYRIALRATSLHGGKELSEVSAGFRLQVR